MRNYTAESYKELVADIDDEILQRFMSAEHEFIRGVEDSEKRTFVDLGAGYGRVVPFLSFISRDVVAIEINPEMFRGLEETASKLPNVTAIKGDFLLIDRLLPQDLARPVFLILQNSLGTIEGGDGTQLVDIVAREAAKRNGSLVLALLRQPALRDWGVSMYGKLEPMVGKVDMDKSDFEEGLMVTDTGYTSKWWTDEDIEGFKALGRVVREESTDEYELLQLDFDGEVAKTP
jgi:SAM-dependent methyltransferase